MLTFVTRAVAATQLALKAHGPTLMVVGGVISMGAAAVGAGKQTLKVEEVFAKHTPALEKVQKGEELQLESYSKDDAAADRRMVYLRTGWDLGKLYAGPIVLFVGGAALVFGGHRMMIQRNATLALAFTGLQKAFEKYRANARAEMGDEFDQAMLQGYKVKEIVNEDGSTELVNVRDWDEASSDPYNRVFEQGASTEWVPDLGINKSFVHNQRQFAQEKLNRAGILYLSDVYRSLGFEETPISRVVGWKIRKLPDGSREIPNVDFGLDKPLEHDWIYNNEKAIYLDFNCQGLVVGGMVQKILERS